MNKLLSMMVASTCSPHNLPPGYANEVGEAFRHTVPVRVVHLSYVLASSYVVAHAASQGFRASRRAKVGVSSPEGLVPEQLCSLFWPASRGPLSKGHS